MAIIEIDKNSLKDKIEGGCEIYVNAICAECKSSLDSEFYYGKRDEEFYITVSNCNCNLYI